ncbi:hypothetical protein [Rhodopseudomonas palustris]|uniref:hypothetical protein n=1 Tax=Rhodopseudomonas palustris TaxID=1076 RepID=UPI00142F0414
MIEATQPATKVQSDGRHKPAKKNLELVTPSSVSAETGERSSERSYPTIGSENSAKLSATHHKVRPDGIAAIGPVSEKSRRGDD